MYYYEFCEDYGLWCVFHVDDNVPHAYSSWASEDDARDEVNRLNDDILADDNDSSLLEGLNRPRRIR